MAQPTEPVRKRITKAVKEAQTGAAAEGKVLKVLFTDDKGEPVGEWASTQLPEDPFASSNIAGLIEPPFNISQLVYLAECHPVHSAALEQKVVDVCGKGWEWEAKDEAQANEEDMKAVRDWFESLSPDDVDMKEVVQSAWLDYETTGWGLIELVREPSGALRRVYNVPSHTVRAHKNGFSLCQIRDQRRVWFRRWGAVDVEGKRVEVDMKTGSVTNVRTPASDLFVIKKPSRRSTWYGIPGYISAVGWITLALAARDDNLFFFANRREPRWAIVLTNMADDPEVEEDLRRAFTVDLRQPHRNLLLPISGPGKVDFQKMSDNRQEGSFDRLSERADKAIMIAHRTPAERLANAEMGPLGGSSVPEATKVYKEGVVGPSQEILQNRLNRLIDLEFAVASDPKGKNPDPPTYKLVMDDLDLSSDREDLDQAMIQFHGDVITLRECRHKLKLGPLMRPVMVDGVDSNGQALIDPITGDPVQTATEEEEESPYNDMIFTELPGASGAAGPPGKTPSGTGNLSEPKTAARASELETVARTLLFEARETQSLLHEQLSREPLPLSRET